MAYRRMLLAAPLAALLAACASQPAATPASVVDTIARQPELSTLNTLVSKAGLANTLNSAGPFTVFAPTNDAFKAVPAKTLEEWTRDPARLKALLSYHVVPAKLTASQVKNETAKSAQGSNLQLARAGEFVTVDDAMVQHADIMATNGVVHTIDRVLVPPAAR